MSSNETPTIEQANYREALLEYRRQQLAIVAELKAKMQCNCDLDNWEPERSTEHSWVCRINKAAVERFRSIPAPQPPKVPVSPKSYTPTCPHCGKPL